MEEKEEKGEKGEKEVNIRLFETVNLQTIHLAFSLVSHIPKALFSVSRQTAK